MIPIETIKAVQAIVTHANCADGMASAMILHSLLHDAEIIFATYATPELAALEARPGMLFVDFSPPQDRAQEFVAAGAMVLDHHKTARGVVEAFGELGVFGDEATEPGVCGAVLAFRHVWLPLRRPGDYDIIWFREFARLAGVRDTWQRDDPQWDTACAQAEALRFWPVETVLGAAPFHWGDLLGIGPMLLQKRAESVAQAVKAAYRFEHGGQRVALVSTLETSDVMDALEREVDLVVGFAYLCEERGRLHVPRMVVSCRSRGLDVAAIARRFGGGGHTRAAGFTVDVVGGDLNPYAHLRGLIERVL